MMKSYDVSCCIRILHLPPSYFEEVRELTIFSLTPTCPLPHFPPSLENAYHYFLYHAPLVHVWWEPQKLAPVSWSYTRNPSLRIKAPRHVNSVCFWEKVPDERKACFSTELLHLPLCSLYWTDSMSESATILLWFYEVIIGAWGLLKKEGTGVDGWVG